MKTTYRVVKEIKGLMVPVESVEAVPPEMAVHGETHLYCGTHISTIDAGRLIRMMPSTFCIKMWLQDGSIVLHEEPEESSEEGQVA